MFEMSNAEIASNLRSIKDKVSHLLTLDEAIALDIAMLGAEAEDRADQLDDEQPN